MRVRNRSQGWLWSGAANGHNHFACSNCRWTVSRRAEADSVVAVCGVGAHGLSADGDDFGQVTLAERGDGGNHLLRQKYTEEKPRQVELPTGCRQCVAVVADPAGRGRTALCLEERQPALLVLLQPDPVGGLFRLVGEIVELLNGQRSDAGALAIGDSAPELLVSLHHRDAQLGRCRGAAQQGIGHFQQSHRARGPAADERNVEGRWSDHSHQIREG